MCGTTTERDVADWRRRAQPQHELHSYSGKCGFSSGEPQGEPIKKVYLHLKQASSESQARITDNGESARPPVGAKNRRPLLVDEWTQADVLKFLSAAFSSFEQWPKKVLPKLQNFHIDGRCFVTLTVKRLRSVTRINKDWCRYIIRLRDDLINSIHLKNGDKVPEENCMDARRECARLQQAADRMTQAQDSDMSSEVTSPTRMDVATNDETTSMSCRVTTESTTMAVSSKSKYVPRKKSKYKLRMQDYPKWIPTPYDQPQSFRQATLFTFDPNKEQWIRRNLECYINTQRADEGGMRSVYNMYEIQRDVRQPDGSTEDFISIHMAKKFKQQRISHQAYFDEVLTQTVAESYAQQFNRICKKKVAFLPASVMQLQDNKELFNVEPCLEGKYEKFSDNFGYVKRTNFKQQKYESIPKNIKYYRQTIEAVAQTFSHFTYETSNHLLVVVDIQGVGSYYTDPQIHTYDGSGFGLGNFAAKGIKEFLLSHKCNKICKACKLTDYSALAARIKANDALPVCERVPLEHMIAPEQFTSSGCNKPPNLPQCRASSKPHRRLHKFAYNLRADISELRSHLQAFPDIAKKAREDILYMLTKSENEKVSKHYSSMAKVALKLIKRLCSSDPIYETELPKLEPQITFLRQLILGVEAEQDRLAARKAANAKVQAAAQTSTRSQRMRVTRPTESPNKMDPTRGFMGQAGRIQYGELAGELKDCDQKSPEEMLDVIDEMGAPR